MTEYTVEQHAVLVGLIGKSLISRYEDYGTDIFINIIVSYANQRGRRMRKRALRDGMPLNYETFLAYGELSFPVLPGDYSTQSRDPYINCCHRCQWYEAWKKYDLTAYGKWYCRYVDMHLVQGFNPDLVMMARTAMGAGDSCCTFVGVGYVQTDESVKRIAQIKKQYSHRYVKNFLYHEAHFLNAFRRICRQALGDQTDAIEHEVLSAFSEQYGTELAEDVRALSEQDFDGID